jgi:hypothetical protein
MDRRRDGMVRMVEKGWIMYLDRKRFSYLLELGRRYAQNSNACKMQSIMFSRHFN